VLRSVPVENPEEIARVFEYPEEEIAVFVERPR
jgi:hypothetical protein